MPDRNRFVPALLLLALLSACSESKQAEKTQQPAKPPELLTGRQAFQRMYPQAVGWATDAQPLQLRSIQLSQFHPEPGQAGAWEATFISASKASSRTYTYSSIEAEGNLHEGVYGGTGSPTRAARTGGSVSHRGDQDRFGSKAYDIAAAKSPDYIKKHPDMPISYLLELTNRFPDLTWRVIWGDSPSPSDYSVFVDATLGSSSRRFTKVGQPILAAAVFWRKIKAKPPPARRGRASSELPGSENAWAHPPCGARACSAPG